MEFKYMRKDLGDLPVKLKHLDIYLNFKDGKVHATNTLFMTAKEDLTEITLDAADLEIVSVTSEDGTNLKYRYLKDENKLVVYASAKKGDDFSIKTETICVPSENILEGIYKDVTPDGSPQQYMSQCQQWGFQRIMPIFDDCRAKCTMITTLEADSRYTHLISNGNIDRLKNPDLRPVLKDDDDSRMVITYVNDIPMAPYLFIACAGTWDVLEDEVVYPDGRKVKLEYLVPPGMKEHVRIPMEILKKSVIWIKETQDYEYTRDCYRTICMTKSNFGGMENVGNTTIVTDSAIVDEHTLDSHLLYAHRVIVHEFEHNQCGSETTMETPFDVWLNEAYTVDVERQFMHTMFDSTFMRQDEVGSMRSPLLGPLSIEDSGYGGRIQRDGFNDPNELIDGVTYVKAAEVIRMLRLIMGVDKFKQAKARYFSRYKNSNANTDQFFECFEQVHGESLEQFKKGWLQRAGYPKVRAEGSYDPKKKVYTFSFKQEFPGDLPFHIPMNIALVSEEGKDILNTLVEIKDAEQKFEFAISEKPLFASMNRDYSFYGTFNDNSTREQMIKQVMLDPNQFNRVEAMKKLTDIERIKLLHDPDYLPSDDWLELFGMILDDSSLSSMMKASFLSIAEQPLDRQYSAWFKELVIAKENLMKAVNARYKDKLLDSFNKLDTYSPSGIEKGISDRSLKSVLLGLIAIDDSQNSHEVLVKHLRNATTSQDKVVSLVMINKSSYGKRKDILSEIYEKWKNNLNGYSNYLMIIASGTNDDVFDNIEIEKRRKSFDITHPSHSRSLFIPMAVNNKVLWTDKGMGWLTDTIIEFSNINPYLAGRMLHAYQHVHKMKPELKPKVLAQINRIIKKVPEDKNPTIHNQAKAYLNQG